MKKNYCLRAAALLLACCVFSLCTVTGTLARYIEGTSIGAAKVRAGIFRVAVKRGTEWVDIASGDLGGSGSELVIDLFETLNEADTTTAENEVVSVDRTTTPNAKVLIAPGTGGEFRITVKNFSEVEVEIEVDSGSPEVRSGGLLSALTLPLEWETSTAGVWDDDFPGVTAGATLEPLGAEETYFFTWRWAYETGAAPETSGNPNWYYGNDPDDTNLAIPGTVTYEIPLTIRAEQID